METLSCSVSETSITSDARRSRVDDAACWVESITFWLIEADRSRDPKEEEKLSADVLVLAIDALPPKLTGPAEKPRLAPACFVVEVLSVWEKPDCASVATASCTSLTARLWLVLADRRSPSLIASVADERVRRDQSTTAMRVLSPGARATLWSRLPRVTP